MQRLASRLCAIEAEWADLEPTSIAAGDLQPQANPDDPFGQLDLLLQEIRDGRSS